MPEYNLKTKNNQNTTSVPPRLSETEAQALQAKICAEEFNRMTNGRDFNRNKNKMQRELGGCGDGQLEVIEEKVIDPRVNKLLHFKVRCDAVPPLFNSIAFALPKGLEVCDFSAKSNRFNHIDRGIYEIFIDPNPKGEGFDYYTVALKPHFVGAIKISHPGPDGRIHSNFIFTHVIEAAKTVPIPVPRYDEGPTLAPIPAEPLPPPVPFNPVPPTPTSETETKSSSPRPESREFRSVLKPSTIG